jgi:hypothetical protein
MEELRRLGWKVESSAKNALGQALGDFDAVFETPSGPCVLEWDGQHLVQPSFDEQDGTPAE